MRRIESYDNTKAASGPFPFNPNPSSSQISLHNYRLMFTGEIDYDWYTRENFNEYYERRNAYVQIL